MRLTSRTRILFAAVIQSLEPRRLLASVFNGNNLNVSGDGGDNVILLSESGTTITVSIDGVEEQFSTNDVVVVNVSGGDGNDRITFETVVASFRTASGDGGNDTVQSTSTNESISGGDGNDLLQAFEGSDTLDPGTGTDTIDGGGSGSSFEMDIVTYASRNADMTFSLDGIANDGEPGENDLITNVEQYASGGGNDLMLGDVSSNILFGGGGDDTIKGFGGDDLLRGEDGDDSIVGGSGDDHVRAGSGNDTVFGEGGNDTLQGDGNKDSLDGGSGNDKLDGGTSADTLRGRGGDDRIFGTDLRAGNSPGPGSIFPAGDVLSGGGDSDRLDYFFSLTGVTVTLDGVANDGATGEGDNVSADFEIFDLTMFDDNLTLAGKAGRHEVNAERGNDTIVGGTGADTISADQGNDSIDGGIGEDRILGGFGDDTMIANDSIADIVNGGDDTDSATADSGLDTVLNVETVT